MKYKLLALDVDGTLIDGDDKPDWGVIGAVLQHHYEHSTAIVIWTGGGVGYAGLWCTRLFPRLPFAAAAKDLKRIGPDDIVVDDGDAMSLG